ncbi:ATP-binding protein [Zoogloea sp.]|uniref:ATP-binding protein n=1 Tax=Zoogloea sp. TaxID=49181 RepID=UPI001415EC5C|nr:MAG: response regulator [Zoogloea sp.]
MSHTNAALTLRRLRRGFLLGGVLFFFVVATWVWRTWQESRAYELAHLATIAEITGNSLDNYFSGHEHRMRAFGKRLTPEVLKPGHLSAVLRAFRESDPEYLFVTLSRPEGGVFATDKTDRPEELPYTRDVPGRQVAFDEIAVQDRLNVGRPAEGRVIKDWIMPLRFGIRDAGGALQYVMNATLPLSRQQSFWHNLGLPQGSAVGLLRDDAFLVSRYPVPPSGDLQNTYGTPRDGALVSHLRDHGFPPRGTVSGHNSVTGKEALFAFRRLEHYPLTVFVSTPVDGAIQRWRAQLGLPLFLTVIALAAGGLVYRSISRWIQASEELRKYQFHLEEQVSQRTAQLQAAKQAAEAASRAKSTFLANMSHELRTPLGGIVGMIRLARFRMADPQGRDQLDKANLAADHLLSVINDILDISKIEADQLVLEASDFQLQTILDSVASIVGLKAREKGLAFGFDLSPGLAGQQFRGDALRLRQILLNLATNAVKFTEQGSITLRVRELERSALEARLRFEVADSGIGIGLVDQARLFSAFEQADNSMTRKYGGTGLGLVISKRLVALMGGQIGVDSSPGCGSLFWFELALPLSFTPAAEEEGADADILATEIRRLHAGKRVLVAEDEPINQEVARIMLEDVGLQVDVAEDGEQAVRLAADTDYALILMDMQMPVMNGIEATHAICAGGRNRQTPILAMTANAFIEDRERCLAAGMRSHIAKPVIPENLYGMLLKWLATR